MRHATFFLILCLSLLFGCASKKTAPVQNPSSFPATLNEAVQAELSSIKTFGRGKYVITGRVVMDDEKKNPQLVSSQMLILPNGDFASAVLDIKRPIAFRLHGYTPVLLEMKSFKPSDSSPLIAVGEIYMTPLKKNEQITIRGKVKLEERDDASAATVTLSISDQPVNSLHNGTAMRPQWPEPVVVSISPKGEFQSEGYSPAPYSVAYRAEGYVDQWDTVDFSKRGAAQFKPVTLELTKAITVSYAVSPTMNFSNLRPTAVTLASGTEWKADPKTYGWDLQFAQAKGKIRFRIGYGPCRIADLGSVPVENFLEPLEGRNIKFVDPYDLPLASGHTYLLDQSRSFKHWVLFRATLEQ